MMEKEDVNIPQKLPTRVIVGRIIKALGYLKLLFCIPSLFILIRYFTLPAVLSVIFALLISALLIFIGSKVEGKPPTTTQESESPTQAK